MIRAKHISTISSGLVASGAAGWLTLWTVNVNTGAGSAVLKLYNGTSTAGDLIASIDATSKGSFSFGTAFRDGLFYDLSGGNADVTIGYA